MHGLDPRIHDEIPRCIALRLCSRRSLMDCRVKPGNVHAWVGILCRWYNPTNKECFPESDLMQINVMGLLL
jgi:hypothetical protein